MNVRQDDDQRKSMVLQNLQKSTDFLRRITMPVQRQGGVTLSYVSPHCHRFPLEDYIWLVSRRHGQQPCNWWCAACGQYSWKNPNRVLVTLDSADPSKAKVFRATFACENLMCDLKLLANQPTGGDSVVDTIFGLQEQSRLKIVDELRRFTEVDSHEAVKIGDPEKNSEAIKVVGPNFDRENISRGGPNWHFVEVSKVLSAPSSTPPKWRPTDGDHRWTRTGTQFVKSSTKASRERNGRTCTTSAWNEQGSQRSKAKLLWKMWGAKDRGDRHTL